MKSLERTTTVKVYGSPEWKETVREYAELRDESMSKTLRDMAAVGIHTLINAGELKDFVIEELDELMSEIFPDILPEDDDTEDL